MVRFLGTSIYKEITDLYNERQITTKLKKVLQLKRKTSISMIKNKCVYPPNNASGGAIVFAAY